MSTLVLPLAISTSKEAPAAFRLGYRPALDGVRGLAVSFVFLFHVSEFAFQFNPSIIPAGFLGVDIFFVLSGFLITSLLLEEWDKSGQISLRRFYARRFFRLIPALLLLLTCSSLFVTITKSRDAAQSAYWTSLYSIFYATNWINALRLAPISEPLGHLWSLAIEEQFYLVWPALLLILLKLKVRRTTIVVGGILLIAAVCAHRSMLNEPGLYRPRIYSAFDTRADSLIAGCVAAMIVSWGLLPASRLFRKALGWSALASLLVVDFYLQNAFGIVDPTLYSYGFTVFAIAVAVLLIQLTSAPPRLFKRFLEHSPFVWAGKLSYSIYLWHFPVCVTIASLAFPGWLKACLAVVLTLTLSSLSYYFVEKPFLKVKKRFAIA
jgi:peptidoglycan/LPS O-acetylase OafA/YrhL